MEAIASIFFQFSLDKEFESWGCSTIPHMPSIPFLYNEVTSMFLTKLLIVMPEVVEIPVELIRFQLPEAVQARLHFLLDRQDEGQTLSQTERQEAEGLVELAEFLSLLRLRSVRVMK